MDLRDWRPVLRNIGRYGKELEAWLAAWSIQLPDEPATLLPPPPVEQAIVDTANEIARRMVNRLAVTNATSWRVAARETLHSRAIYLALQTEMGSQTGVRVAEIIRHNAKLIQRLPNALTSKLVAYAGAEQRKGIRASEIGREIEKKLPTLRKSLVKMFARTEVGRAETALTRARSERLGLDWYEWATSEDQRVRPSHRRMASVLVAWSDPPSPEQLAGEPVGTLGHYAPGGAYNCRCIALPLVSLDEVQWPHKIYTHGSISRVTRAQFERFVDIPQVA